MKHEKGFSLVELLVVVIIIAIIAAIAIPNLLASRRAANESSAIQSLRTIHSANATYQSTYGGNTTYGNLENLGATGLIDSVLGAAGTGARTKSGYSFVSSTAAGTYCATGAPVTAGSTGDRSFGVGSQGVVYQITAASQCASGALSTTAGSASPIQ